MSSYIRTRIGLKGYSVGTENSNLNIPLSYGVNFFCISILHIYNYRYWTFDKQSPTLTLHILNVFFSNSINSFCYLFE